MLRSLELSLRTRMTLVDDGVGPSRQHPGLSLVLASRSFLINSIGRQTFAQ